MAEMERSTIFPPSTEEYTLAGDALDRSQIDEGGVGTAPAPDRGMQRYPTENVPPRTHAAWRRSLVWSAMGAAIGAGAATLVSKRRARRRRLDHED